MNKKSTKSLDLIKTKAELNSLRKNLMNYSFQKSTGQLEKTSNIKKTRRKIASLMTKMNNYSKDVNNA